MTATATVTPDTTMIRDVAGKSTIRELVARKPIAVETKSKNRDATNLDVRPTKVRTDVAKMMTRDAAMTSTIHDVATNVWKSRRQAETRSKMRDVRRKTKHGVALSQRCVEATTIDGIRVATIVTTSTAVLAAEARPTIAPLAADVSEIIARLTNLNGCRLPSIRYFELKLNEQVCSIFKFFFLPLQSLLLLLFIIMYNLNCNNLLLFNILIWLNN
jgi:hypothetical protein